MIQTQRPDGTWKDAFAVSNKPERTAMQVAHKTRRPTRIIQRDDKVIYQVDWNMDD